MKLGGLMEKKKRYINATPNNNMMKTLNSILKALKKKGDQKIKAFNCSIDKNDLEKIDETKKEIIDLFRNIGVRINEDKNRIHFLASYNFTHLIEKIINEEKFEDLKSYQYYATKDELAKKLVALADFKTNHEMTLEPSAGQGAIAQYIPSKNLHCVEYSAINAEILKQKGFIVFHDDFIHFSKTTKTQYERVIMSPPFLGGKGIQHVVNAYRLLKTNGILVAVLPEMMKDQIVIENEIHHYSEIMPSEFENTNVNFVILKIVKEN